jgi:hypothetical protein
MKPDEKNTLGVAARSGATGSPSRAQAARLDPRTAGPLARPAGDEPDRLLALDIETVPDADLLPADWPDDRMPKPLWHKVACVSFVEARILRDPASGLESYRVERVASGGQADWDERRIVAGFWRFFAEGRFRIVSWNGRSFDLPVLLSRAYLHGIPTAAWHLRGGKWDGYARRYSDAYHADVMDLLSGHGAATRMGLDETATALGLPGKMGEHGSRVADMVGRGDRAGHDDSVADLVAHLERERGARPHLGEFVDAWRRDGKRNGERPGLAPA